MTEINGLRLAYRGLVAGLAGGYLWLALAMLLSAPSGDPLAPARTIADAVPMGGSLAPGAAFVVGLGLIQVAAGTIGICFAYFVARYLTIRPTVAVAAPCVALLVWFVLAERIAAASGDDMAGIAARVSLLVATLVYGIVLGAAVPTRRQVERPRREPRPVAPPAEVEAVQPLGVVRSSSATTMSSGS
ncbi:MAG TPA: hypothetical protein VHK06_06725 [Candidatus Limnocylindria bacterium]|nr:hypothetical protein [Candidatus Limnocylindria bacterium]